MKITTKFILGLPILALACGSIAFAKLPPLIPADSAAKAAAQGAPAGSPTPTPLPETVEFQSGSRWYLSVNAIQKFGLVITDASFQKSPDSSAIYVLRDGRLGEIFVPYHPGDPRFFDVGIFNFPPLTLDREQFPPPRDIIGDGKICKEVRDYLAWMNAALPHEGAVVRYGQEVVYFSVLDAGNYAYIEEWTFRDDGTILVRAGSTGPKNGYVGDPRGHMHNFTWRLDIDLGGAGSDSAYWTRHVENLAVAPSTATDEQDLISVEGGFVWDPLNFNTLQIGDSTLKNGRGRPTYYELVPMRSGTARHRADPAQQSEAFTEKDFWVTRHNPAELLAKDLPTYVDGQPTVNEDLVIWYTGSEHHENNSRDEDRNTVPVLWTGFALVPNNLFDGTPFYRAASFPTPRPRPTSPPRP